MNAFNITNEITLMSGNVYDITYLSGTECYEKVQQSNHNINFGKIRIFSRHFYRNEDINDKINEIIKAIFIAPINEHDKWENFLEGIVNKYNGFKLIKSSAYFLIISNNYELEGNDSSWCDDLDCPIVRYFPRILIDPISLQLTLSLHQSNSSGSDEETDLKKQGKNFVKRFQEYIILSKNRYYPTFIHLYEENNSNNDHNLVPICYDRGNPICEKCIRYGAPLLCLAIPEEINNIELNDINSNEINNINEKDKIMEIQIINEQKTELVSLYLILDKEDSGSYYIYLILKKSNGEEDRLFKIPIKDSEIMEVKKFKKIFQGTKFKKHNINISNLLNNEVKELSDKIYKILHEKEIFYKKVWNKVKGIYKNAIKTNKYEKITSNIIAINEIYKFILITHMIQEFNKNQLRDLSYAKNIITFKDLKEISIRPLL